MMQQQRSTKQRYR